MGSVPKPEKNQQSLRLSRTPQPHPNILNRPCSIENLIFRMQLQTGCPLPGSRRFRGCQSKFSEGFRGFGWFWRILPRFWSSMRAVEDCSGGFQNVSGLGWGALLFSSEEFAGPTAWPAVFIGEKGTLCRSCSLPSSERFLSSRFRWRGAVGGGLLPHLVGALPAAAGAPRPVGDPQPDPNAGRRTQDAGRGPSRPPFCGAWTWTWTVLFLLPFPEKLRVPTLLLLLFNITLGQLLSEFPMWVRGLKGTCGEACCNLIVLCLFRSPFQALKTYV